MLIGAALAPTDAALGQPVITNPAVPARIRHLLNIESGLNDGICVPLLAITLAIAQTDAGETSGAHAAQLVVEAIGWGIFGGVVAGAAGGLILRFGRGRGWIGSRWSEIIPVAAAAGAFGLADARGGSGFIAAFVGGTMYGWITKRADDTTQFTEELGGVLNALTLIVFGAVVLGTFWSDIGLVEIFYAILSLTVVRMIPVAIAMLGTHARRPTVAFLGWFGPRGLASIVFGVVVIESGNLPHTNELVVALTVTVALSVYAHGVSAAPLARRYAAWYARSSRTPMESVPVAAQRWRLREPT
jgi:sodium/hydrogen antiporter